ncbi:hypothetical protein B4U80_06634 [Leptotrombidium deliense]|uniref:Uncharacterized protein n=1 Tax=Leptotrombidium deliense TaxID=299467 RepID=A0A443S245_9ACAR|nr:hypothetical protein B4U80_06634 [Leptotrombidium deliense]
MSPCSKSWHYTHPNSLEPSFLSYRSSLCPCYNGSFVPRHHGIISPSFGLISQSNFSSLVPTNESKQAKVQSDSDKNGKPNSAVWYNESKDFKLKPLV